MALINVEQISQLVEVYSLLSAYFLCFSILEITKNGTNWKDMGEETILTSKQLFLCKSSCYEYVPICRLERPRQSWVEVHGLESSDSLIEKGYSLIRIYCWWKTCPFDYNIIKKELRLKLHCAYQYTEYGPLHKLIWLSLD